jgi:hypothetical protein
MITDLPLMEIAMINNLGDKVKFVLIMGNIDMM